MWMTPYERKFLNLHIPGENRRRRKEYPGFADTGRVQGKGGKLGRKAQDKDLLYAS